MKRAAIGLWCAADVSGAAVLATIGLWIGVCWWPEEVGPRLPPWLAFRFSGMGNAGFAAGSTRFGEWSEYWVDHKQTPEDIAACNATLCRALRASRHDQLLALRLIRGGNTGFVAATPERNALVFALTTSPDSDLRKLAIDGWKSDGVTASQQIRAIRPDAADPSPISPDRWVPGQAAGIAWRMMVFIDWRGDDHIHPGRYQKYLRDNLDRLLTYDDGNGRFANDARDNAVISSVLAALSAATQDEVLKPIVLRAGDRLAQDRTHLAHLWQEDTTTALMTAMCLHHSSNGGLPTKDLAESQHTSFAQWWNSRTDDAPPLWYSQGKVIPVSVAERWAAATIGGFWCHHEPEVKPPAPPLRLADPTECSPLGRFLAMTGAVIYADPRWKGPFRGREQELVDTQIITPGHDGLEGCWPAHGEVSAAWQTVFSVLELNNHWPYDPHNP